MSRRRQLVEAVVDALDADQKRRETARDGENRHAGHEDTRTALQARTTALSDRVLELAVWPEQPMHVDGAVVADQLRRLAARADEGHPLPADLVAHRVTATQLYAVARTVDELVELGRLDQWRKLTALAERITP